MNGSGSQALTAGIIGASSGVGLGALGGDGAAELATVLAAAVAALVSWLLRRWLPA